VAVVGSLERDRKYAFEGEALSDVEACSFDRARFDRLVSQTPALAAAVAEALSDALKQTAHGLTVIGRLKATERVANFLAEICALYEQRAMLTGPLTLHMRRDEIADYLGLATATVSRSLARLKKLNVVDRRRDGGIVVIDPKKLKVIAVEKR
jgi:CRP/FNR family transcriptional regulator, anaerobic regulatory protein